MRIDFKIFGEPASVSAPRVAVIAGKPHTYAPRGVAQWKAYVRSQALPYAPETVPLGPVRIAIEVVRRRKQALMTSKYWWRCKSRKCGWKGKDTDRTRTDCSPYCCPKCHGPVIHPAPTPPHTIGPDFFDNLHKPLLDALTDAGFWHNDAQITGVLPGHPCGKRWAEVGEQPHVSIAIQYEPSGEPEEASK